MQRKTNDKKYDYVVLETFVSNVLLLIFYFFLLVTTVELITLQIGGSVQYMWISENKVIIVGIDLPFE